ncbi:LysR family transcriptional regulator [Bradyrhizobium sp. CCGB12]|uniref:LysR family transcriptional regulator n=1 Tax=Bradyrhizobium sp. CCGB12 TaxID=2949632 RepID=UPI0020B2F193|nr:LysR family transcriptional regulator [Bradyrhizobium sp. CCGB12]MCP3392369.1 LysR family transcriptional regulator [Bradyrhizobium sp. CCGB12]
MDWDDLRIYLQLARSGQMTSTAKALGIDDSTVGRRIARLETAVGLALVERAGRRTVMTEQGRRLAETVEELESLILRKVAGLAEDQAVVAGRVRVGAPEGFGVGYLARRLAMLSTQHPHLETELVALPRVYSLAAREVDIAITLDRPTTGLVTSQKLTDYTLDLYGTEGYFKRRGRPKSLTDLPAHVFSGYIPELLFTEELNFSKLGDGVEVMPSIRSSSVMAQVDAVECGAAIGVLPTFLAGSRPLLKVLLADKIRILRSYWISVHEDVRRLHRIRTVLESIVADVRTDKRVFLRR